jgi:glycosyltransferase involved in cell wall biosynthesis
MNKDNKTLIILTPGFARDETDTACLPFLQNFIKELNEQFPRLNVIILAFDYPFKTTVYQWNGKDVVPFNGWGKRYLNKLMKWLRVWIKMKKITHSNHVIGILSLWCTECAYLGSRFAKRNHLTHFCWIQGQDARKENKYVNRIKPASAELIALSDFIQTEFERNHGIKPVHVIPVGIRPAEFPTGHSARDIDILGVGSLIPLKQYDLFIEIISIVKLQMPDIQVTLCGKGTEESKLTTLIEKYGLQENIRLTGELTHREILGIMNRSRIFLHTSNYEGLGVVCIEALYAGCHVVSYVQPMDRDIEHWHIVKTKEEMFEKTKSLLDNPGTLYKPVVTFTSEESVKKIMQLFNYKEPISS